MGNAIVLGDPWLRIAAACKKSRADVAVAYVGQGATRLLPLRAGSKLVVDASEAAVRSGQTDPRELLKYLRDGVELFSKPRLHAKVFAFSNVAFVGSNNVSNHSANALIEAAVGLTTAIGVAQARHFVLDAAKSPMGEEFLKKLVKIYRPPRFPGGAKLRRRSSSTKPETIAEASPLRLVKLASTDWDAADMAADAAGRKAAKKLKTKTFKLESFSYSGWSHRDLDEEILQVVRESNGEVLLYPPGRALAVRKVRNKDNSIVVLEVPPRYRRKLSAVRKRLPKATVKRLARGGLLDPRHAELLRGLWA